jgi:hypothetical protein
MTHRQLQNVTFLGSEALLFAGSQSLGLENIACASISREHCSVECEPQIYTQIVLKVSASACPHSNIVTYHTSAS